jgi:ethanolamine utilization microcompartment shell protein EutS
MDGVTGTEIAIVSACAGLLLAIVAIGRMWIDAGVIKQMASDAAKSAHDAHQRIDRISETTATKSDMSAAEQRFTEAVSGMRSDFQHMASRLDTVIAGLVARGSATA